MRTTLDIDDEILGAARRRAAEQGKSLTAVVEEALAALLAAKPRQARKFKLSLPVHRGGKLQPGVDLDDRASLYDLMEGRR